MGVLQKMDAAALSAFDVQTDRLRSIWALDSRKSRLEHKPAPLSNGLAKFLHSKGLGKGFPGYIAPAKL